MASFQKRFEGRIATVGADGAIRPKDASGTGKAFQAGNAKRRSSADVPAVAGGPKKPSWSADAPAESGGTESTITVNRALLQQMLAQGGTELSGGLDDSLREEPRREEPRREEARGEEASRGPVSMISAPTIIATASLREPVRIAAPAVREVARVAAPGLRTVDPREARAAASRDDQGATRDQAVPAPRAVVQVQPSVPRVVAPVLRAPEPVHEEPAPSPVARDEEVRERAAEPAPPVRPAPVLGGVRSGPAAMGGVRSGPAAMGGVRSGPAALGGSGPVRTSLVRSGPVFLREEPARPHPPEIDSPLDDEGTTGSADEAIPARKTSVRDPAPARNTAEVGGGQYRAPPPTLSPPPRESAADVVNRLRSELRKESGGPEARARPVRQAEERPSPDRERVLPSGRAIDELSPPRNRRPEESSYGDVRVHRTPEKDNVPNLKRPDDAEPASRAPRDVKLREVARPIVSRASSASSSRSGPTTRRDEALAAARRMENGEREAEAELERQWEAEQLASFDELDAPQKREVPRERGAKEPTPKAARPPVPVPKVERSSTEPAARPPVARPPVPVPKVERSSTERARPSEGYASRPAEAGYSSKPTGGGYGSKPAEGGYASRPAEGGYSSKPPGGGYGSRPDVAAPKVRAEKPRPRPQPASRDGPGPRGPSNVRSSSTPAGPPDDLPDAQKLLFSKKPRDVKWQPKTLAEYRELKPSARMGHTERLGADLENDELQKKKARAEKIKQFSLGLREVNATNTQRAPPPKEVRSKSMEPSQRQRALEFAKNVPKPKVRARPEPSAVAEEQEVVEPEATDLTDEVAQLLARHDAERLQAQLIREQLF